MRINKHTSVKFFLKIGVITLFYFVSHKMVYSVSTQHQYISFLATCFGFYKNHLQSNVNYREVHSVRTYIMYLPVDNLGLKMIL